jgi:Kef-type K+ transport system membrane component KefB
MLLLLVQISVILIAARLVGGFFQRLHQPQVIGEMCAWILLGPSLFGWLAPQLHARLFPAVSLNALHALSQIGLLLFMFLVGLELSPQTLRKHGYTALITSSVSMIAPFLLGTGLAFYLYPRLADSQVPIWHFGLFLGTALSVTAFPVLARILTEHGLQRTQVGTIALTCAAIGDV